jgi:hypothetical protein
VFIVAEGFLEGWRYYRALAAHRKVHPEWMSARQFSKVLGVTAGPAATYRKKLQEEGILEVEEGYVGKVPFVRSRLTPEGVRITDHLLEAAGISKRARDKARS